MPQRPALVAVSLFINRESRGEGGRGYPFELYGRCVDAPGGDVDDGAVHLVVRRGAAHHIVQVREQPRQVKVRPLQRHTTKIEIEIEIDIEIDKEIDIDIE